MKDIRSYENFSLAPVLRPEYANVKTERVNFLSAAGDRIVGFCDRPQGAFPKGHAIVVPPYGKTKSSDLPLAYYLALNGFQVLRYDHTHHVGESDGSMLFASLSQMLQDLTAAIDFVETQYGATRVALVSSSLGVRVALKAARRDQRVGLLIGLIGVFNLQQTLYAMYREDGVEKTRQGIALGLRDILGFQIDADHFLADAIRANFHSLDSSLEDAGGVHVPTVLFVADRDPWVVSEEVKQVFDRVPAKKKELHWLRNTMHELYENPVSAHFAFRKVVAVVEKYLAGREIALDDVQTPEQPVLARRFREEKKAQTVAGLNAAEEKRFWKKYLEKYAYIVNLQDYWNLLDFSSRLLGDWKKGERVLDAGCGIGNFGTFILIRQLYQLMQGKTGGFQKLPLCRYLGVDFVDEAVRQARDTHQQIQQEFKRKLGLGADIPDIMAYSYLVLDLNQALPFNTRYFDKIYCNFVVSYLNDPLRTVKDLFRTLKTRGKMVVTSLKPYADLSQIYRDFIEVTRSPQELEQARLVLNNAGMIKHKEAEGYYQFFSEVELRDLLMEAGGSNIQIIRSFGDQANVAVAEKSP
ncbi:MAG TPA: alpha/beta hydrolase [Candidatus Binatia bacterium]|jgi:SAM-dependent methyltransferase/alpha-beta hydrolase superfamily lysophospholipase